MRIYYFFYKFFLCFIIFLIVGIVSKKNIDCYNYVKENIYNNNIHFSYFKDIYNKYLGGVFPINNIDNKKNEYVFDEKLEYTDISDYLDGAKLKVDNNYLIPSIYDGIVVFIGNKDKYGNVVIIENSDGINVWYGNVCNTMVKLYDNINKGNYIGESCSDYIYLVYDKDNKFLDYKNYLY